MAEEEININPPDPSQVPPAKADEKPPETPVEVKPPEPKFGLETKLEGDDVPGDLKGRTVGEVYEALKRAVSAQPAPPSNQSQVDPMEELKSSFYQDPIGTIDKLIQIRMSPVVDKSVGREIESRPYYTELKPDIDRFMSNVPTSLRSNPDSWDIAYKYAVGNNFEKLSKTKRDSSFLPNSNNNPPPAPKETIGSEEHTMAVRFGMTDEEYMKWK